MLRHSFSYGTSCVGLTNMQHLAIHPRIISPRTTAGVSYNKSPQHGLFHTNVQGTRWAVGYLRRPCLPRSTPSYAYKPIHGRRNINHSGFDPFSTHKSTKRAIWSIIAINGLVFGAWQYADTTRDGKLKRQLVEYATVSWTNIKADRWYTTVTSAFSHANLPHFAFNMWALYVFGSIIAAVPGVGGTHIWSLGVGSAIAGSLCWLYHRQSQNSSSQDRKWDLLSRYGAQTPVRSNSAQGASGMVMGAGAVAACLIPRAPMYLFFIPIPIPLWLVTILYAAADIYYLDSSDRIGHAAHLGGFVYGVAYYAMFLRRFGGIFGPRIARW